MNVTLDGELLFSGEVVAMHAVAAGSLFKRLIDRLGLLFADLL